MKLLCLLSRFTSSVSFSLHGFRFAADGTVTRGFCRFKISLQMLVDLIGFGPFRSQEVDLISVVVQVFGQNCGFLQL